MFLYCDETGLGVMVVGVLTFTLIDLPIMVLNAMEYMTITFFLLYSILSYFVCCCCMDLLIKIIDII